MSKRRGHRPSVMAIGAAVMASLIAGACAAERRHFDEDAWRSRGEAVDPALYRAPHYSEGRYFNPWMTSERRGPADLLSWLFAPNPRYPRASEQFLPRLVPDARARIAALPPDRDFAMWLGHSSIMIRLGGRYWIVDPVFDQSVVLLRRRQPPALTAREITTLHGEKNILITHNHYDHLEWSAMKDLPREARVYAPLGLKGFLKKSGRRDVVEMDWWQEHDAGAGIRIVCLPAQHWSRRLNGGVNTSLWAGFLLITPRGRFFFAGDTGYFGGFREIGRAYPGIDWAFLPIGASQPRWFMHYAHMDSAEALRAMADLGARGMIPIHWGTFALGEEPPGHSALILRELVKNRAEPSIVRLSDIGEIVELNQTAR